MVLGGWAEPHMLRWDFLDTRPRIICLAEHAGGVSHSCTVPMAQDALRRFASWLFVVVASWRLGGISCDPGVFKDFR